MSNFSISDFKSQFTDLVRQNRFIVNFNVPIIPSISNLFYYASSVSIPSIKLKTKTYHYMGYFVHLGFAREETQVTVNFIVDNNFTARQFFENWMEKVSAIWSSNDQTTINSILSASMNIVIFGNDNLGDLDVATYTLYNVVPSEVEAIDFDYSQFDNYATFKVTFNFSYFDSTINQVSQNGILDVLSGLMNNPVQTISNAVMNMPLDNLLNPKQTGENLINNIKNSLINFTNPQQLLQNLGTTNSLSTIIPSIGATITNSFQEALNAFSSIGL